MVFHFISSRSGEVATVILVFIWSHDSSEIAELWNGPNKIQTTVLGLPGQCSSCYVAGARSGYTHSRLQAFPSHTITKNFRFLQCCWKLMRWDIPPTSSLVAPGLWKLSWWKQETRQSDWEMTKCWGTMKPYVQRAVICFCLFLLELNIWA